MLGLGRLKQVVRDELEYRAMRKHRSRLGRHVAPQYTAYWSRCRAAFDGVPAASPELLQAVREFERDGFTSFWTPENEKLARSMFDRITGEEQRGLDIEDRDRRYRGEIYTAFPDRVNWR